MGCGGSKAASAETPTERPQERGQQTTSVVPASAQSTAQAGESDAAVASTDVAAATQSPAAASGSNSTAKILVLYYSTYGHIQKLAEGIAAGLKKDSNLEVTIAQAAETLPQDVLDKMHAPPKAAHPVIDPTTLDQYDGIIFGTPTRFGMMSTQMKSVLDATGGLWQSGALRGKPAGFFVTTATQGGGQETTPLTGVTQLVHHGMVFVPFGYGHPVLQFSNAEAHGGTPYGPGSLAGADGSAQPSEEELNMCSAYGEYFGTVAKALKAGKGL